MIRKEMLKNLIKAVQSRARSEMAIELVDWAREYKSQTSYGDLVLEELVEHLQAIIKQ